MLGFLFPPTKRAQADGWSGSSNSWFGGRVRTTAGVDVNEDLALTYAACWCASRIICEGTSCLPLNPYSRGADDDRTLATGSAVYDVFKNSMAFRYGRVLHQVNWGNAFAEILRDPMQRLAGLAPIHPSRVRPSKVGDIFPDNRAVPLGNYLVRNDNGTYTVLMADEMLHIPGAFPEDGVWGKGTVAYARETIGGGLAADKNAGTSFGSGNVPRVVVSGIGFKDTNARDNFRKEWKQIHGAPDAGNIAVMPQKDVKVEKLDFSPADAQFLESRAFSKREVATWYRVPPHMIGELESSTFASVEAMGLEFVIYSLYPWLRAFEEQVNKKLFSPVEQAQGMYVEHLLAGLLRGDLPSRITAYRGAIMTGILSINECRRFENLNKIEDGDEHYLPVNVTTVANIASGNIPGATGGPGSDQTTMPGEKPPTEAEFDGWARQLRRTERDDLNRRLLAIERVMMEDRRAAAVPVPLIEDKRPRIEAAQKVLLDTLSRLFRKEANAVERAAKGKEDFDAWLPTWYAAHETVLASALAPACQLLATLGAAPDPQALAKRLSMSAQATLGHGYNTLTPAQFAKLLAGWHTERAADEAAAIVRECCGGPGSGVPGPCPTGTPAEKATEAVDKLGEEVQPEAEKDEEVRGIVGKSFDKVVDTLKGVALGEFPSWALDTADTWLFEHTMGMAGSAAGFPGAIMATKAAAWGAAKGYLAIRGLFAGKNAMAFGMASSETLDDVAKRLHEILTVVGEAAGYPVPTLEELTAKLEEAQA